MAGIGFRLRRILRADTYLSQLQAYGYAAMVSSGPWLFTVLVVGLLSAITPRFLPRAERALLQGIIIHVYALTLVTTGSYLMIASRHLADRLWLKDVRSLLPAFLTLLLGTGVGHAAFGVALVWPLGLSPAVAVGAVSLTVVVATLWLEITFLSAAKDYERIALAFGVGAAVSVGLGVLGGAWYGLPGCLYGFTAGQVLTATLLLVRILHEFEVKAALDLEVLGAFFRYGDLGLTGLFYFAGIWVDKVAFWWSPLGTEIRPGLRTCPDYDGTMFLAYLTVIPALSLFMIRVETSFYEAYRGFFEAILQRASEEELRWHREDIRDRLRLSVGRILQLQGTVSVLAILVAPSVLPLLGFSPIHVPIFRVGVLAAFLQVLLLLLLTGLLYVERRRAALLVSALFFVSNGAFTLRALQAGLAWAGYGYAAACLLSVVVAYLAFDDAIRYLVRDTFLRQPVIGSRPRGPRFRPSQASREAR